jgi:hypothetical protein
MRTPRLVLGPFFATVDQGGGGGRAGTITEDDNYALDKPYDLTGQPTVETIQQIDEMLRYLYTAMKRAKSGIASAGSGNVVGPASSVTGDVALFSGVTGKLLSDSGKLGSDLVTGPAVSVDGNIALFNGVTGKILKDAGTASSFILSNAGFGRSTIPASIGDMHSLNTVPLVAVPAVGGFTIIPLGLIYTCNITVAVTTAQSANLRYTGTATAISASVTTITSGATGRKQGRPWQRQRTRQQTYRQRVWKL